MNAQTYESFDVRTDRRGVTTITLDVPGRPMNVFDGSVMKELNDIVRRLQTDLDCKAVVFRSGKESGFLAGADVNAIAAISSPVEAAKLIDEGQRLFNTIDWLTIPTIAVIHGPCLGGGLEWALACDYRIARDNSSTKIGLPEIKLGLIPGWGGTQRLPKLVGLKNALTMILKGTHLSAGEAYKIGLVDQAISPDDWDDAVDEFVEKILISPHSVRSGSKRPVIQRIIEATQVGRSMIIAATKRRIDSKSKQYPALGAALRSVRSSYGIRPKGFMTERNEFIDLLATPTCRHLLQLFFDRESARSLRTWTDQTSIIHEEPIRKVGIIGAGAMGAGIAQLVGYRGYDVVIKEINEAAAEAGRTRVNDLVNQLARHKKMNESTREQLLGRIRIVTEDEPLSDADLVIEAIVEKLDVKRSVFRALDRITTPETIFASNTSSLSVTDMATATQRGNLVAGLHFFNPVHKMELVEVVRAKETNDVTIARLVGFVRGLGKTPIVTADTPGFLVNRVLFPYLGEAVLMVAEGHSVANIDKEVRRFGMPMGPLELLDQVGLDVALHVSRSLESVLSGLCPVVDQLAIMVEDGLIGKKASAGFYWYLNGKKKGVSKISQSMRGAPDAGIGDQYEARFVNEGLTPVQRRLIYPMLAESIRAKQEGVVQENWAIDLAMVLGTGFAPHRGGPLHTVDSFSEHVVHANLNQLQEVFGDRFVPPRLLVDMAKQNLTFFPKSNPQSNDRAVSRG
ncbi:Fatty acid oxidation complex subunit alpha [Planctomycetes bacterium CA13]|uniref:enoyl-CoA hydratase n=1 Tax=Novipirellula herctigrandis TaxID=2527986 RepID=A0A5C5YWR4_9BACT|nr:Fatty acid oxidation complex subunit alpha [Planctomycetes bacterium CA13]